MRPTDITQWVDILFASAATPPKHAHEVPRVLFDSVKAILGAPAGDPAEPTEVFVESNVATQVITVDVQHSGEFCFVGLTEYKYPPQAVLRVWLEKPAPASDDVFQPRDILSLRGGPRHTGIWTAYRGTQCVTDVTVEFNGYAKLSALGSRSKEVFAFLAIVMQLAAELSENVEETTSWDDADATIKRGR